MSSPATTHPRTTTEEVVRDRLEPSRPWIVIVWDDPVNLMSYVTYVFRKLFGYPEPQAHELMMRVHTQGKAVVASGSKERCEYDVQRLHAHGLWASMQED